MRDCPSCGKAVDGLQCGSCGYSDAQPRPASAGGVRMRRGGACEHRGCPNWGTFKPQDTAGPWHCWRHYPAMPMPAWFKSRHPDFAKTFRPMTEAQLERAAIESEAA